MSSCPTLAFIVRRSIIFLDILGGRMAMRFRLGIAWVALVAMSLAIGPASLAAAPLGQQTGPNLLQNGDFEWSAPWDKQDGINEIQVAPGWRGWWLRKPPPGVQRPYNCGGTDYGCYWAQPEFSDVQRASFAYRVHGGFQAQKYFTYGRMHEAGLMQQVGNIQTGVRLRFSIYMQAWMCFEYDKCGYGQVSDKPSDMHLRVGIDPTGGNNPFSPEIVWSGEQSAWDTWVSFQVEAVARNSTVTVYTHSRADWDWARKNNDVYIDDANLVVIGHGPAAQPTSPPLSAPTRLRGTSTSSPTATRTATVTPTATATPAPTDTPVRRVLALPPEDTATPTPRPGWFSGVTGSDGDSPGGVSGVILLGAALFLGAILVGIVIGQRLGPRVR